MSHDMLDQDFGSFDVFKQQMIRAAATIMGSGWATPIGEPIGRRLLVKTGFFESIWNRWYWRDITVRREQAMKWGVGS